MLLVAASLKLFGLNAAPYAQFGRLASPNVQLLVIEWEISLGFWLLSGQLRTASWIAAMGTIFVFAGISSYLGLVGQASCGCFGAIEASPWWAFGLDAAMLAVLTLGRPDFQVLRQMDPNEKRQMLIRGLLQISVISTVFLALFGVVVLGYSSPVAALAHLRGDVFFTEPDFIDFGNARPGEVVESSVSATNWSEQPIRLIGGTSDCSCITTRGLLKTGSIRIHFKGRIW